MALTHIPANDVSSTPNRLWWLSLLPRLSAATKRSLFLLSLSAALLINGQWQVAERERPAGQNAWQQLGLPGRDPVGPEFQVNGYTSSAQGQPVVALDSSGDFVVVWSSYGSDGGDTDGRSVQGQRFNSLGTAQGSQFQVNSYSTNRQSDPAVAMDSDGDFVVIWYSVGSSGNDSDSGSIQGQRYNSAGVPQGSQFQVNGYSTNLQFDPAVSMDSDGDFVVVWQSVGSNDDDSDYLSIQGQRYNSAGVPQGSQFQVNSYTTNSQGRTAVALDSDGDFVVVWVSNGSNGNDNNGYSIQGQRYNSAGMAQGSQFQVNSYFTGDQTDAAVSMDSDGDFVVVWDSFGSTGGDSNGYSIQGQRYNSAGVPQGSQFQVNSYSTNNQSHPAVALDSDGDFVVVWMSYGSGGSDSSNSSIQGQGYNSLGTAEGSEFQVNSYTSSYQEHPTIARDSDGDFVVVWRSYGSYGSDTSSSSIQGQRYMTEASTPTPTATPSTTPTGTPTPTNTPTPTPTAVPAGHFLYLPAVVRD